MFHFPESVYYCQIATLNHVQLQMLVHTALMPRRLSTAATATSVSTPSERAAQMALYLPTPMQYHRTQRWFGEWFSRFDHALDAANGHPHPAMAPALSVAPSAAASPSVSSSSPTLPSSSFITRCSGRLLSIYHAAFALPSRFARARAAHRLPHPSSVATGESLTAAFATAAELEAALVDQRAQAYVLWTRRPQAEIDASVGGAARTGGGSEMPSASSTASSSSSASIPSPSQSFFSAAPPRLTIILHADAQLRDIVEAHVHAALVLHALEPLCLPVPASLLAAARLGDASAGTESRDRVGHGNGIDIGSGSEHGIGEGSGSDSVDGMVGSRDGNGGDAASLYRPSLWSPRTWVSPLWRRFMRRPQRASQWPLDFVPSSPSSSPLNAVASSGVSHPVAELVWPLSSSAQQTNQPQQGGDSSSDQCNAQTSANQSPQQHDEWLQLLRRTRAAAVRDAPAVVAALTARGWNIEALAWPDEGVRARWDRKVDVHASGSTSGSGSSSGSDSDRDSSSTGASGNATL